MTYYVIFEENKYKGKPIGIVKCDDIHKQFYKNHKLGFWCNEYYVTNLTFNKYIEDKRGVYAQYKTDKYKNINNFIKKHIA